MKNGRKGSETQRYLILTVADGHFDSLNGKSLPERVSYRLYSLRFSLLIIQGLVGRKRKD